jgi:hypothetical protein
VGERASGITTFQAYEFFSNREYSPIILGTPPADYKLNMPGQFTGEGLPAGEYRVYLSGETYFHSQNARRPILAEPIEIAKFTLKEDQRLDIGNLKADAMLALPSVQDSSESFTEPEDIVPVFRP